MNFVWVVQKYEYKTKDIVWVVMDTWIFLYRIFYYADGGTGTGISF